MGTPGAVSILANAACVSGSLTRAACLEAALAPPGRMATLRAPCRRAGGHHRDPPRAGSALRRARPGQKVRSRASYRLTACSL
jgi:hypothetical protein